VAELVKLAETLKLALPFTAVWFEGCDEIVMIGFKTPPV
jgi:hypothetical protein